MSDPQEVAPPVLDGATRAPSEMVMATTAGEFAARWNAMDTAQRSSWFAAWADMADRAALCFMTQHSATIMAQSAALQDLQARLAAIPLNVYPVSEVWLVQADEDYEGTAKSVHRTQRDAIAAVNQLAGQEGLVRVDEREPAADGSIDLFAYATNGVSYTHYTVTRMELP